MLTVWRLDRLGRTMRHLVNMVHEFGERGIGFRSITEAMDTTTPGGELLFHIAGALAQFERRNNLACELAMHDEGRPVPETQATAVFRILRNTLLPSTTRISERRQGCRLMPAGSPRSPFSFTQQCAIRTCTVFPGE